MKPLYYVLGILFSVALFFVLLFTSIEVVVYNMSYFEKHYEKRDIMSETDMSLEDLMDVTIKMMDYLKDREDNLDMEAMVDGQMEEVFGEREKLHMVDVKDLFLKAIWTRNFSIIYILGIVLLGTFKNRKMLVTILGSVKFVFVGLLVLAGGVGYLFYTDFDKYFVIFHEIFFDNDLWQLNPRTDILINMVPIDFFFETAMYSLAIFFTGLITVGIVSEVMKRKASKKLV
ncbi:MAG: TIGR01906 family membrane protein [Vallitaleaceae bacterium]|jgi:integral membrane protein (TIGR01906 family)|nr:TIGR01906 family membrane protein [Vallitaleaceae bacterium]